MEKYFAIWKRKQKLKKEKINSIKSKLENKEKLNNLINSLKKYKKNHRENDFCDMFPSTEPATPKNYKNRFKAQKTTIDRLTLKLEEKDRLIQELKLGILDRNALKSATEAKFEIREIFADCSVKVRCKVSPPQDYNEKFMITTQKAPKILQEMEERALERAKRREIIFERKRIIEENRKRILSQALENKRVQDEEEKKQNLEIIKEHRRKELEREKLKQERKLIFLEKYNRAIIFYNSKSLKWALQGLRQNLCEAKYNEVKSCVHYKTKLIHTAFKHWLSFVEDKYHDKNVLADAFFAKTILSKTFKILQKSRIESIRAMQVAEDFYDLLLLHNSFVHWHRYVCVQVMWREQQIKNFTNLYNR